MGLSPGYGQGDCRMRLGHPVRGVWTKNGVGCFATKRGDMWSDEGVETGFGIDACMRKMASRTSPKFP